jgi:2-amino-4-hydroxy-6-hydroxymethyldihydropteridine diphosphokinase
VRAFVALGSNLGDRWHHLREAVHSLPGVVAVSPVYETAPDGGPAGQGDYLNCVVELQLPDDVTPRQLLGICHRLESAAHRVRTEERWGPRTLDVDILLMGDLRVDEPDLQVPHPRMRERRFVLQPLRDLAPELVPEDLERLGGRVRQAGTL